MLQRCLGCLRFPWPVVMVGTVPWQAAALRHCKQGTQPMERVRLQLDKGRTQLRLVRQVTRAGGDRPDAGKPATRQHGCRQARHKTAWMNGA
jgi:hypothetical protein